MLIIDHSTNAQIVTNPTRPSITGEPPLPLKILATPRKLKLYTAIIVLAFYISFQLHFWHARAPNPTCNNDHIIYSLPVSAYQTWISHPAHSPYRTFIITLNLLYINIFGYFLSIISFAYKGSYSESFFTWLSLTYLRALVPIFPPNPQIVLNPIPTPTPKVNPHPYIVRFFGSRLLIFWVE